MSDLPPPSRVYTPLRIEAKKGGSDESTMLLRALRLSQTRAREAEEKASHVGEENKAAAAVLFKEFLRLSAHRRWVKLLEAEVTMLREKRMRRIMEEEGRENDGMPHVEWYLAFALCLGVGVVGFVFWDKFH
ncbi:uncharacterized protein LOC109721040 [Ananas comosus]|uniref:Uncharacterized protein LOC109721040 n=1 Tax=Ananas comosus TaxID=4615 RepID=A0A6P5G620_ANACO|nr:uncharacterized protein LOC109721040 [Ananas comosus]